MPAIVGIEMNNQTFKVQSSSYLAGDTSLVVRNNGGQDVLCSETCSGNFKNREALQRHPLIFYRKVLRRRTLFVDTDRLWHGNTTPYNLRKAAKAVFPQYDERRRIGREFGPVNAYRPAILALRIAETLFHHRMI